MLEPVPPRQWHLSSTRTMPRCDAVSDSHSFLSTWLVSRMHTISTELLHKLTIPSMELTLLLLQHLHCHSFHHCRQHMRVTRARSLLEKERKRGRVSDRYIWLRETELRVQLFPSFSQQRHCQCYSTAGW